MRQKKRENEEVVQLYVFTCASLVQTIGKNHGPSMKSKAQKSLCNIERVSSMRKLPPLQKHSRPEVSYELDKTSLPVYDFYLGYKTNIVLAMAWILRSYSQTDGGLSIMSKEHMRLAKGKDLWSCIEMRPVDRTVLEEVLRRTPVGAVTGEHRVSHWTLEWRSIGRTGKYLHVEVGWHMLGHV